jgi:hypothetical protein
MGTGALQSLTNGYQNTASGDGALYSNTTGFKNTASGFASLQKNTSGYDNAAFGSGALVLNSVGSDNAAFGMDALYHNVGSSDGEGSANTAAGSHALYTNQSGVGNTASGYEALYSNLDGAINTALGDTALFQNSTGTDNTAIGESAVYSNVSGNFNTGVGGGALVSVTGSNNVGLGYLAGENIGPGSNNIDIGSEGAYQDNGSIRIGTEGTQKSTFVAGIADSKVIGAAVYITSSGRLGVLASSERYKTGIAPLGAATKKLQQLRPVSFHLKSDPGGAVQYGLIAEEVDKVYPELVIRDGKGAIQGVRYDELAPMLLSVVQQQGVMIQRQNADLGVAKAEAHAATVNAEVVRKELAKVIKLNREMQAALSHLKEEARIAMR